MKLALLLATVALVGAAGCSDDDSISPVSPTAVRGPGTSVRNVAPFRGGAIYRPEIDPALIGLCYNPWCGCYNGCAGLPLPYSGFAPHPGFGPDGRPPARRPIRVGP